MNELELEDYYAAGLIDGEGTITLAVKTSNNHTFRQPVISISSTTKDMLVFMMDRYGGSISTHKTYQAHHKESYSWKLNYVKAAKLCEKLAPLFKEPEKKRRAYLIANEYYKVTKRNGKYSPEEIAAKLAFQDKFFENSTKEIKA